MFATQALGLLTLAPLSLVLSQSIDITNRAFPGGGTGSPSCIPACQVTITDFYDCVSGTVDLTGECPWQEGLETYPVRGCEGYTFRWDVRGEGGAGFVNVFQDSTTYTRGWEVVSCPYGSSADTPLPEAGQQCAVHGSCEVV